ncbi:MAG: DUF188 domain-containing protein [Sphaerochaetaceae bacterium]|jgi:uncharacterized protein YaiI (UPF0178 family)|nr:DUF188 domain-containing protein [Sphaerochaetaceae bacterium]
MESNVPEFKSPILWVDSDSCPVQIRSIILKAAIRLDLETVFVSDRELKDVKTARSEHTAMLRKVDPDAVSSIFYVVVPTGADSADDYIVENADNPDALVITRDVPLSSRLASKGLVCLDDRGRIIDWSNAANRLSQRDANYQLREAGVFDERNDRISERNIREFSASLDRHLNMLKKKGVIK